MENKIKILVADDHPLFRSGVINILKSNFESITIIEANDGAEAYKLISRSRPIITIVDINMPVLNGIELIKKCNDEGINTSFIVLTMHKEKVFYDGAIKLGVKGYVLKSNAATDICDCVNSVLNGDSYVSRNLSHDLVEIDTASEILDEEILRKINLLSSAEKRVIRLIAIDKTSKEIADMLFLSYKTIENHRANICKKLDLEGTNALLKFVLIHQNYFEKL